ncbi:hypothetical protein ROZALSC1DRAFT_27581 [Rozella allomycis CSF55]|uniref:Uncharacterized protein n=1 Tax=Rozella allomycis (strain CSF55) TaxID=988480 RepID=A0A075ASC7_ROZAC|nr:hypothetical protein O9G_000075 [Rozella allomycis CSF55]RKP20969.1 hypothetical protein ROZALSC1DRAFT_27581 [Rozella allomycis CSF55]|eukprot:EPZ31596.1 hypothetical protein O9G_000075 [Rozella allomycis CSF55]
MSNNSYWTISTGSANRMGHSCRECKQIIHKGENVVVRDGRCYSQNPDPRTQTSCSFKSYSSVIQKCAPEVKGKGKWSTSKYGYKGGK